MKSVTSRILLILMLVCVSTSLLTIFFNSNSDEYKTETAVWSTEDDSVSFKAVYVRNEELLRYSGGGVVSYCIPDGGKLGNGSLIAEVYADEGQIDVKQRLSELKDDMVLLEKIQNPGTMESAQPANLSALINEKYKKIINAREKGNISAISDDTNELIVLLSTYQMVTDETKNFNKRMNDLKTEIDRLSSQEMVPMDTIRSEKAGYFVSYADGYEEQLSMDKLSSITVDTINEVSDTKKSSDKDLIGKLITGYEWYVVGIIDNRDDSFNVEDEVQLKFQSTSEQIGGVVFDIKPTDEKGKNIVVVKCNEITYDLVQHRTERVEMIKGQYKGIKVSRKAIRFKEVEETETDEKTGVTTTKKVNCKGVYIKLGEQISFKKLDVIYEGNGFVLSSIHTGSDYVSIYDDVIVEGVGADGS